MKFTSLPYLIQLTVHSLIVAGVTKMGLLISPVEPSAAFVWSPAGLSIVIVTVSGLRYLPAVLIGTASVYIPAMQSIPIGIVLAAGSTVEAAVGVFLLHRNKFGAALKTFRDVGTLLFIAGAAGTFINAVVSITGIALLKGGNFGGYDISILLWWTANLAGLTVIAPLLFVLLSRSPKAYTMKGIAEMMMVILIVHLASRFVFHETTFLNQLKFSMAFVLFPFAVWAAVRFGIAGSVVTTYVIAMNAVLSVHFPAEHFISGDGGFTIFVMSMYLTVLGTTSLVLGALTEERVASARSLEKSRESYRILTEQTGQIIYDYDVPNGTIQWTGALVEVTQYTPEEFVNVGIEEWTSMIHPDDRDRAERELTESMRAHREFKVEYRLRRNDGTYIIIMDRGAFLYRRSNDVMAYRMLGTMADVSHVHQTLSRLNESEERFRILIEKSADGIILMDDHARISFASDSATSIIGYSPEELKAMSIFDILHPSEIKRYTFRFGRLIVEAERSEYLLGRFRHKSGEWVSIEGMVTNLLGNSAVHAFVANFRNVTDRINAEERQKQSLHEKEILLKEVHHRVKNNMQVISSLLNLQSSSLKDERTLSMFRESQNRVKSMALIHEILYRSQDIASVNFSLYVKQMTASLQKSFGTRARDISVKVKIPNVVLEIDEAIPCGLIVNELVSNSIKYAFPKRRNGEITVELKKKKNRFVLSVRDNGVGLPKKAGESQSLGLTLVRALSEQLKGELTITVDRGTTFTVEFPIHQSMIPAV
ncbi:MAG: histidine kinase dimerization/phosphoacceptor domain -containing protein [Bacteroidota bacterium]